MYERFYHLRDRPFALSPDPDYLYPSRVHREALDYLRFGIEGNAGFVVITGEIGSGKTTLLQVLLRNIDGQTTVIRLVNTLLTGPELLESMLLDLGVEEAPPTKPAMLRDLARILIEQRSAGRRVVAVIDEAQNLSLEALEELRMLSNLETEKSKLIQIVLVGQPDLRDQLALPALEQLRQRVTVRYHIDPLDTEETANYINHRLKRASIGAPMLFPRDVTDAIHARSRGVPRLINVICDAVLLFGYADERRLIDLALVRDAIEELEASSVLRPQPGDRRSDDDDESSPPDVPPKSSGSRGESLPQPRPMQASAVSIAPPLSAHGGGYQAQRATAAAAVALPSHADVAIEMRKAAERAAAAQRQAATPSLRVDDRPHRVAEPRPNVAPFRPQQPSRNPGAWTWMKEVFFGSR
jgi:putative secretion ATPase (PEP-CTERM system associated)